MRQIQLAIIVALLLAIPTQTAFDISNAGKAGTPLSQTDCNTDAFINFYWSSTTTSSGYTAGGIAGTVSNKGQTTLGFRSTGGGPNYNMSLSDFSWTADTMTSFASGYRSTPSAITIAGAAVFKYVSSEISTAVYVYIPVTTAGAANNADVVDLTSAKGPSPSLASFDGNGPLSSSFSFLNLNNYNQWYIQSASTKTVLVSRYVYKVTGVANLQTTASGAASELLASDFSATTAASTGDKLCYASASNFRTSLRSIVAFWFIWFAIFIYWLIYLFSDSVTKSCFDTDNFTENIWTCWSLYSIAKVAHEQFFTKLSRMTVVLTQLSLQGLFIAAIIYSQYTTGPAIVIWSAVIAWLATIIFPFIWGSLFHKKIYQRCRHKYDTMKMIMEAKEKNKDKEEIKHLEDAIDTFEEKIYGYYHWFYCITFTLFVLCWPITVHLMQNLPRTEHAYNWYWLAAMAITFFLEHFVYEPLLVCLFHRRRIVRHRGGYFYDIRIGEGYDEVTEK